MGLWAYFDDSETQESSIGPAVGFAGCIATVEAWCRAKRKWDEVLERADATVFHAAEWEGNSGLYRYWLELIDVLNKHMICHVGCVVPAHAVRALICQMPTYPSAPRAPKDIWGYEFERFAKNPESVAVSWCLTEVVRVGRERSERICVVFSETDQLEEKGRRVREAMNIVPKFQDALGKIFYKGKPRDLIQLQAADLVACELTKYRSSHSVRAQYAALRPKSRFHTADPPHLMPGWLNDY